MEIAEKLGINVYTGQSLESGRLINYKRKKGCYARDGVSSLLQIYKSINSHGQVSNWAGCAFATNNLQHIQTNLDILRLPPMSQYHLREIFDVSTLRY